MTSASQVHPFYLDGPLGPLCAVYYPPIGDASSFGDVLVVPALAEEMNRCRSMISLQAHSLAQQGVGTLVLDPFGSGDSAGEFVEFTWLRAKADLQAGIAWLRAHGNGCHMLWGIRLGATMAAELAVADKDIHHLLLWQPVLQGKLWLTQFLRIRVAAELEQTDGVKTTDELRRRSKGGEAIEVSGYRLAPDLCTELDAAVFPASDNLKHVSFGWCEVVPSPEAPVSASATKAVEKLQAAGVKVDFSRTIGPSFWQVHERMEAPELLEATAVIMKSWSASSSGHTAVKKLVAPVDTHSEQTMVINCGDDRLVGVLHTGNATNKRGVVGIVAGGPQYRAGAHRQFVSLARKLAKNGFSTLRFDLRGMGDSSGAHLGFQQSAADIKSAIDALLAKQPHLNEIVLFGECESASGILFYAYRDPRVKGVVLVNPWVRTDETRAGVIMKHYYWHRLTSRDFWRKLGQGKFNPFVALSSFFGVYKLYRVGQKANRTAAAIDNTEIDSLPLPQKTAAGFRRFGGRIFVLMSGHDYIAREFDQVVQSVPAWQGLLENERVTRRDMAGADHTFSRDVWKSQASDWVVEWLGKW